MIIFHVEIWFMIVISKFLVPKGFIGLTLYPFILLKTKELKLNESIVNHEKIHLRQQLELLIVFFYIFYTMEWLVKCYKFKNRKEAYRNISFEREAYSNENDKTYLKKKKIWSFISYL